MDLRSTILEYVYDYHKQHESVPSIRTLTKKFQKQGLTTKKLYSLFPGGQREICKESGIPIPNSLGNTRQALRARAGKIQARRIEKPPETEPTGTTLRLTLTDEQTMRIFGLSHMYDGRSPSLVVDDLLNQDATLRRLGKGERLDEVIAFIERGLSLGWTSDSLLNTTANLWNEGIMNLQPIDLKNLSELLQELRRHSVSPKKFVADLMDTKSMVHVWRQYLVGAISADEAFRRARLTT